MLFNSAAGAIAGYTNDLGPAVVDAFRTLLEEKHLYQSVTIDDEAVRKAFLTHVDVTIQKRLAETASLAYGASNVPWILSTDNITVQGPEGKPFLHVTLKQAKLYCKTCDRVEAYNLETARSAVETILTTNDGHLTWRIRRLERQRSLVANG